MSVTTEDLDLLTQQAKQFRVLIDQIDQLDGRRGDLRKWLLNWLDDNTEAHDDKGNREVVLDEPFTVNGKKFQRVSKQIRSSTVLDPDVAGPVLKALGVYDEATETETYLVPEKVAQLWADGKISDEDYNSLWKQKSTTALVVK